MQPAKALQNRERLSEEQRQFILRTASGALHRYVTCSDDVWSIALIAYWEAMDGFCEEKGAFVPYAQMVIKRRIIDYQRKQIRLAKEILVPPITFTGEREDGEARPLIQTHNLQTTMENGLRDEIESVSVQLEQYGISFSMLPLCSPKSQKTKRVCTQVITFVLDRPLLITQLIRSRRLPIKAIAIGAQVPTKVVERYRNYIITAIMIHNGDYPALRGYIPLDGKQGK